MNKYILTYNGKTCHYNGINTGEVMDKFINRKVFGNPLVCRVSLKMYDADTRGKVWAQYVADDKTLMIEEVKK